MSKTVIHSALLFDGEKTHPSSTVIFDGSTGLITSVSTSGKDESFPSDATVIDGKGHTLLPGLIEAHMHCYDLHLPPGTDNSEVLKSPLKSGLTTCCNMHSPAEVVHALQKKAKDELDSARKAGKSGRVTMADLKSSHLGATIDGGWPKPIVLAGHPSEELIATVGKWPNVTVENAADFVRKHKADGADYIKLMQEDCCSLAMPTGSIPTATVELQTAVVKAAHAEGIPAVGHANSIGSTEIILNSGADGLTHTFIDQPPTDAIVALYKKTGAFVIPTLVVLSSLTDEEQTLRDKFAKIAYDKGIINDWFKQNMIETLGMKSAEARIEYAYESIRRLKKEGIDIVAGTDAVAGLKGTAIGPSMWQELEMYVDRCGFSITEALRAATSVGARRFGFTDRGNVAEGKRADLLLVKGDLTERLERLWGGDGGEGIVGVWKEGIAAK